MLQEFTSFLLFIYCLFLVPGESSVDFLNFFFSPKNLCMCFAEIWPVYTGAGLNLGVRVLDEVERENFIALPG